MKPKSKSKNSKRTQRPLHAVVGYVERKNIKHVKDAAGHLKAFQESGLSWFGQNLTKTIRCQLAELLSRLTDK